jgi:hypothetical protein
MGRGIRLTPEELNRIDLMRFKTFSTDVFWNCLIITMSHFGPFSFVKPRLSLHHYDGLELVHAQGSASSDRSVACEMGFSGRTLLLWRCALRPD